MESLTTMRSDVDSIGRDQLMQVANLGGQLCEGFGRTISSVQNVAAQLAQGQSRTEAAVLTTGLQGQLQQKDNTIAQLAATHANEVQGMRNTFDIVSSQKDCCCTTKQLISDCCCETNRNIERQGCETRGAIHAEGEATRALIAHSSTANACCVKWAPRMPVSPSSKPRTSTPTWPTMLPSRTATTCSPC